ncbi:8038_t:CDS:1, partial [Funneliformis geosporum]
ACNSKFQRLRHEDKITSQQDNELSASDISSNEKETDNNDTDGIEE